MRVAILIALILAFVATSGAEAQDSGARGQHASIYVVPRSNRVIIDGNLDDWDLSGQIHSYVAAETRDLMNARFALMYDENAIYISAQVRDSGPMMNRHDPEVEADRGWDADACQFRMVLDPAQGFPLAQDSANPVPNDQMVHMLLWYYTDKQQPALQLLYGMNYALPKAGYKQGVVPSDKYQAAYRKWDDGQGYSFEYKIPWKILEASNPPKAGDIVPGTMQIGWGTADGLKSSMGSGWAYDIMSGPGFPFQNSMCWGKLIFALSGNLQSTKPIEAPQRQKPLSLSYVLPEEGEVSIALFNGDNLVVRQLITQAARKAGDNTEQWDGLDDLGRPIAAGEYFWKGIYHQPLTTKHLLSVHNSGNPPYKTADNTGGWGGDHGLPYAVCIANKEALISWNAAEVGWGIIKTDLKGRRAWGTNTGARFLATDGDRLFIAGDEGFFRGGQVRVISVADSRPINYDRGTPDIDPPTGGTADTNHVTGIAYGNGTLFVSYGGRDLVGVYNGLTGESLDFWKLKSPGQLAVNAKGTLFAISSEAVYKFTDGQAKALVTKGLDHPTGIAVSSVGNIYVANAGKLQNVSVFDKSGKLIRSIGKAGGRPGVGRYDENGMLNPTGIALDPAGQLWVAEASDYPKRVSVWNAATGSFLREFFGGSAYATSVTMDPKREDEVFCHNVLWKVNLDKGTWKPYSTIWRSTKPNMADGINPGGYAGHIRVMTAKNGGQFAWGMYAFGNYVYKRDGDIFKPFLGTIIVSKGNQYLSWPPYDLFVDNEKHPNGCYLWQDANDDQVMQDNEVVLDSDRGIGQYFNWIDEDMNLWCDAGFMYRPISFRKDGRPVYDFSKKEPTGFAGVESNFTSFTVDANGIYQLIPDANPGFIRYTRDHKMLWGYQDVLSWRNSVNKPLIEPGKLWGTVMPLGSAGDFTGIGLYAGPIQIFTSDGICVGQVFRDQRLGETGADVLQCESFAGQLVKMEKSGRYLLLVGDQDGRVTQINGLETVQPLAGGRYRITDQDARMVSRVLDEYQRNVSRMQPLVIVREKSYLDSAKPIIRQADDSRSFSARIAYDKKNLYLKYDVTGPSPLMNTISDPKIIFKGGNCMDLQLATAPKADPDRTTPAPGDIRLLITRQEGKPLAVLYRPKVAGAKDAPITLSSPTGHESFDVIKTLEGIDMDYQETDSGFSTLATIPLSMLGWTPESGSLVKIDIGYLFGNKTGNQCSMRKYWSNNGFTASIINDIPNESRLEPGMWGTARVE